VAERLPDHRPPVLTVHTMAAKAALVA
jgi:hypothetical protein